MLLAFIAVCIGRLVQVGIETTPLLWQALRSVGPGPQTSASEPPGKRIARIKVQLFTAGIDGLAVPVIKDVRQLLVCTQGGKPVEGGPEVQFSPTGNLHLGIQVQCLAKNTCQSVAPRPMRKSKFWEKHPASSSRGAAQSHFLPRDSK